MDFVREDRFNYSKLLLIFKKTAAVPSKTAAV